MDIVQSVALAGGMAWASGIRLYIVLFGAGLLSRVGYIHLPTALQVLESPLVLAVAGIMLVLEFVADKIPAVDSVWDSNHTFIRIPIGALLAALSLGDYGPAMMVAAGLLGGALTAGTQAAKASNRLVINRISPEPFANVAVSLGGDALVPIGLFAAYQYSELFLCVLGLFVVLLIWLLPKLLRDARRASGRPLRDPAA